MRAHTCTHYTPVMVCEVFVDMPSLVANRLTAVVAPGQILDLRGERGLEVDTHAHMGGYPGDACAACTETTRPSSNTAPLPHSTTPTLCRIRRVHVHASSPDAWRAYTHDTHDTCIRATPHSTTRKLPSYLEPTPPRSQQRQKQLFRRQQQRLRTHGEGLRSGADGSALCRWHYCTGNR